MPWRTSSAAARAGLAGFGGLGGFDSGVGGGFNGAFDDAGDGSLGADPVMGDKLPTQVFAVLEASAA